MKINNRPAQNHSNHIRQVFWLYFLGMVGGLALPFLVTILSMRLIQQPISLSSIVLTHLNTPLLWVVDVIAVLVVVGMLMGMRREQNHSRKVTELQDKIARRIGELYSLKEIYHHEIQDRQQAEINISRAKREWETTFDAIPDLILLTDSQGKIIRCNQATALRLERTYADILGKPIEKVFPGVLEPIQKRVINKTQVIPMPSRYGWFEVTGFQFQVLDDPPGMLYIFHDIAERKSSEAELQRQKQYFEAIFQNSPAAIVTLDLHNKIVTANPAFEYLFGYSPVEAAGKKLDDLITPPGLREKPIETTRRFRRTEVRHEVSQRQTKQRIVLDVEIFTVPVVVKGETLGTLVLFYNITDLVQARRKAEDADLAKSAYLANISHEIRTPLNGLIGLLNMTLGTPLTPVQAEYLGTAADQAEELVSLLNEILDLSKIEAGRMQLESISFDLRMVMENASLSIAQRAFEKGIELICILPPSIPTRLKGDPNRLRQVLSNLVANAVKFTDEGEVVLSVRMESEDGNEISLEFSVQDTGIGIPAERQAAIFDRFTQADLSTPRMYGGTGLGLAISSQIVELMGGKISLESQAGRGSIFSFTIRFEKLDNNEAPSPALTEYTRGRKTLIVDQNPHSSLNLQLLLGELECVPSTASDLKEGLKLLEQSRTAGEPYSLLVLDDQLVRDHEMTLVEELGLKNTAATIKTIILVRMGNKPDEYLLKALNSSGIVLKPVRRQPLHHTMFDLFTLKQKKGKAAKERLSASKLDFQLSSRPQHILIAEDNPVNRKVITNLLEKFGHSVTAVENGQQAVEAYLRSPFSLIIMDVQMPDLDGHEAASRIRMLESGADHIPILALTGHTSDTEIQRCKSSGMDECLIKPVRSQELFKAVETWAMPLPEARPWLEQARDSAGTEFIDAENRMLIEKGLIDELDFEDFSRSYDQLIVDSENPQNETSQDGSPPSKPINAAPTRDYYNTAGFGQPDYLEKILSRFGDDLPFFVKTFNDFVDECKIYLTQFQQAEERKDATTIHLLTHNLKGLAANFEVDSIVSITSELETLGDDEIVARVSDLISLLHATIPSLDSYLNDVRTLQ